MAASSEVKVDRLTIEAKEQGLREAARREMDPPWETPSKWGRAWGERRWVWACL